MSRPVQGHLVRMERQRANVDVEQLAADTGISADILHAIETGQREASVHEATAIAEALGANVFDFYGQADKSSAYRGNRSVHSAPIGGHEIEALAERSRRQRELEGQSDRERELGELESLEQWHVGASREQREEHAYAVRRMRDLRTKHYGSPTGQRSASGMTPQQPRRPQEPLDVVWTNHGPEPVWPVGVEP